MTTELKTQLNLTDEQSHPVENYIAQQIDLALQEAKKVSDEALVSARDEAQKALESLKADAALINTTNLERIEQLEGQVTEAGRVAKLNSESAKDLIAQANTERDAQIVRSLALASAAKAARERRKAADAAYVAIDAEEDAIVAEASKGLDEQAAAQKEAKRAALEAELAKLA